jgi:preprotein translocase subunit YajC
MHFIALVQEAAAQAPPNPPRGISGVGLIFQIAAILAIIYFFLIRPQQKERKRTDTMLSALKKGDEIVTAGGIVGEVVHIQMQPPGENGEQRTRMDDRVTMKSGDSRLIVERGRITTVLPKGA